MGHKFPSDNLSDDVRRQWAAEWIEIAVLDLKWAANLLTGRAAEAAVLSLILAAEAAAEVIRRDPAQVAPTKTVKV